MKVDEIISSINKIRKNKTYVTNAFMTLPQLYLILSKQNVEVISDDGILLILELEKDLIRIYFYAAGANMLMRLKGLLPDYDKPIIADIVGKNPYAENLAMEMVMNGFEQYSIFIRMSCSSPKIPENVDFSFVEYAVDNDVDTIYNLIYSEFDSLVGHIPKKQEISKAIEKQEISVVRLKGEIVGIAYFEIISILNICLRYFVVKKQFQGQAIGKALLANTFTKHNQGVIYTLWISTANSTVELYNGLNFKQDGVKDYILKFKGE